MTSFVLVERPVPEVAVVTLNRPERMNSMAFEVMVHVDPAGGVPSQRADFGVVPGGKVSLTTTPAAPPPGVSALATVSV